MKIKFNQLGVLPLSVRDSFKRVSQIERRDIWKLSFRAANELMSSSELKDISSEPYYYISLETGKEGVILIDDRTDMGYFAYEE
jgi:hypothetical protein